MYKMSWWKICVYPRNNEEVVLETFIALIWLFWKKKKV
jgi:hypothetical protein